MSSVAGNTDSDSRHSKSQRQRWQSPATYQFMHDAANGTPSCVLYKFLMTPICARSGRLGLIGKPINEEVIRQHWGDIMRLAASIRDKSLKPSEILRKLGAYRQQNRLYLALGEIGRIERTLFMLDWIENANLRMDCHAGLNKGEARHSLARAIFAHSQGRIHDRSDAAQQKRAMALNLVIAAISFWNTIYMDKAAGHLARTSPLYDAKLLTHTSPLGWDHVILSGDFDWHSGAAERTIARPLNIRPTKDWGA